MDPKKRPTCDQILHMPVFTAKHNELKNLEHIDEQGQMSGLEGINMLGTIRLPANLKFITDRLPESNYDSDKDS